MAASVLLSHGETTVTGIGISTGGKSNLRGPLEHVTLINSQKVPWFLVSLGPFPVYSTDEATTSYFGQLAHESVERPYLGLLAKSPDSVYVVFYIHKNGARCFFIDFSALERLALAARAFEASNDDNVYYLALPARSDTTVFDRVLENKSSKRNQYVAPRNPSATPLSVAPLNGDQIATAVNRLTLSGLRLRGLNPLGSKDRIAVRELYQMTRKLALFALRKFKYEFNGAANHEVRLSDVQDVVERLLQAYADVD